MIYVFNSSGQCLEKNFAIPAPQLTDFEKNYGVDLVLKEYGIDPLPDAPLEQITATIDGGEVIAVNDPPAEPQLWLHGSIDTGTVNQLTGTRYIERGEALTYSATLRETADPNSDPVANIPGTDPAVPITGSWALELVHELGLDQFSPMVDMTAGVISGSVTIPDRLCDGLYKLPEERLADLDPAKIGFTGLPVIKLRLADPAAFEFKVRS